MKKLFILAAIAAAMLTACTKPEQKSEMALPSYKTSHASLTFRTDKFAAEFGSGVLPVTVELTSDGRYIIGRKRQEDGKTEYKTGTFTLQQVKASPIAYDLSPYGRIVVKDPDVKPWVITFTVGGKEYEVTADVAADIITGAFADDLCRNWKPASIVVSAKGGDLPASLGAAKTFTGGDLKAVGDYLVENGIKVDVAKFSKFNIDSIEFTESGKVFINFKDTSVDPYFGTFTISGGKENNFSYDFKLAYEDNPVIPVKGVGTVSVKNSMMSFYTESEVQSGGKVYSVSLTVVCNKEK